MICIATLSLPLVYTLHGQRFVDTRTLHPFMTVEHVDMLLQQPKKIEMKDKLSYSPLGVQRYLCLAVETCPVFLLHYHVRQISAIRVMILRETLSSCGEQ